MPVNTEVIIPNIATGTAEGPVWIEESKKLLFSDAIGGDVHLWDSQTGKIDSIKFDTFIPFVIPHTKGGYVAGLGRKIIHFDWNQPQNYKVLAEVDKGKPTRLNDAKCDSKGRMFFGTMGLEKRPAVPVMEQGSFFSMDTDNKVNIWDTKFHVANSVVFSPDYKTVYLTESVPGIIYAWDYDLETGTPSNRRVVTYLPAVENGVLDRMTVDTEGYLWTTYYRGGKVDRIDPKTGDIVRTEKIPCSTPTCLIFGGDGYRDLFITSSIYEQDLKINPHAGSIFRMTGLGVQGIKPNYFQGK